jgi:microcin C transport system substrate-binding protein
MPALRCRAFLYPLLFFCAVAASLGTYSVGLADPFPGKEAPTPSSEGVKTHTLHTLTLLDSPRYPDDFAYFDYVNPDAPKRGILRTAEVGTFHNLAPFILQKSSVQIWLVYEQLFTSPRDDPLSSYPLIAESVEIADDKSFVIFHLNPMARWQDGILVTSEDVVFTFNTLRNHEKAIP